MKINLHDMKDGRVFDTAGPNVEFGFSDSGQANVSISLRLSDGAFFHYPRGLGKVQIESTQMPPGTYRCVVAVSAVDLGVFGKTYDTEVTIGGRKAVSASGAIPNAEDVDQDFQLFMLRVR